MRPSTLQNTRINGDREPALSNSTERSGQSAQHVFAHKEGSSKGQCKTPSRDHDSSSFMISNMDFVTEEAYKDYHPNVGGLCGAMDAAPTWGLPMFIRKAFKPLFSCRDDERAAQTILSSSTFDSARDTGHDGSTTKCSNACAINTRKPSSGYAMGYSTTSSEEYFSSAYSTDSSTDSESEKLREENRRWRRGF